jgi:16S rRNA (cytosine1402-N4)-methyltransferase
MPDEVARDLISDTNGFYADFTAGAGGHSIRIMKTLGIKGRLIAMDRDPRAVAATRKRLEAFGGRVTVIHGDYRDFARHCEELGIAEVNGVLIDLGLSSLQLDDASRGMSYRLDGPLDLRFDTSSGIPAYQWLASATEFEIADAIFQYGEEPRSRSIARRIIAARVKIPIHTSGQLLTEVESATGFSGPRLGRTAARVWQALRIVVNDELGAIPDGLSAAIDRLSDHGRLVTLAYHSLEDRIVKTHFREASRTCDCPTAYPHCICGANPKGRLLHRHVLRPSPEEVAQNSRAAAARMRVFERVIHHEGAR